MGSIITNPAFNSEESYSSFRNSNGQTSGGRIVIPDFISGTDPWGFPLTENQKAAREIYKNALESHKIILSDRANLSKLINDISLICNSKPTGWKQKILDLVKNSNFKGTAGNITAAVFSLGIYGIVAEVKKKKEAVEHCNGIKPGGKWMVLLNDFDTKIIPASESVLNTANKKVTDADAAEFVRRQQEAANEEKMNLAKTASERAKIAQENARLRQQREDELKALKAKQAAELAGKKDRNRTIIVASIAVAAVLVGGMMLIRK